MDRRRERNKLAGAIADFKRVNLTPPQNITFMKVQLFCLMMVCTLTTLSVQGQRGANWVLGTHSTLSPENNDGTLLNFKDDTLKIEYIENEKYMSQFVANTGISDKEGNLLFYTNGCYLANALHDTLKNSEAMSPGIIEQAFCDDAGHTISQHQMILPKPNSDHLYYTFQLNDVEALPVDTVGGITLTPTSLTYSVVDMREENGLGAVVEKNTYILRDTLSNNGIQAVKHANGRDWWVIVPKFESNCHFKYLFTPEGIFFFDKQCLGKTWTWIDRGGQSIFSPDGNHYIRFQARNYLNIFGYDRCSGQLTLREEISFIHRAGSTVGTAVSPNSRFLYAMVSDSAFQYDLWASNIASSKILIAVYDGFQNLGPTRFRLAQLAPDGKIYIASNNLTFNLHVIEYPDSLGTACNFIQHAIELPTDNDIGIPIYPNYALGPLTGECDTLPVSTVEPSFSIPIRCYPNPAQEQVTIEIEERQQSFLLRVSDSQGRTVATKKMELPGSYRLNTSNWPNGLYLLWIEGEDGISWRERLLILRE